MKKPTIKGIIEAIFRPILSFIGRVIPFLYYIVLIVTFSGVFFAFFSVYYLQNPGFLTEEKNVIIQSGSSTIKIAKQLAQNQVIEYPQIFMVLVKISESGKSLKAGEYNFKSFISPMDVMKKLQMGDVVVRKLTIPEGLMTSQILEIIQNTEYLRGEIPAGIVEGELLPETYDYHYGDTRKEMIQRMQAAMQRTLNNSWNIRMAELPFKDINEALVLASIIEKETGVAEERRRVAAVFVNRLKKNMRLQTDPTVIYAVTMGKYVLDRPLSYQDLEINSPYNTYRNFGLPPTPIANPGRASIEAVLNPLESDELYFVANGSGGHIFASTLEKHNENVSKWRKIQKGVQKESTQ